MTEKKPLPEDRMLSGLELAVIAIELEKTQKYKSALEEIAYHVSTPLGQKENYEDTVYEFIDIAKRALGY